MTGHATPRPAGDATVPRDWLLAKFPPEEFERGTLLIESTFMQTGADRTQAQVAYVHEGLVRGVWNRSKIAPSSRATALVAGDGCWVGVDVFKFGENIFRYLALAPTVASLVPVGCLRNEAPRAVVVHAMENIARDWCTAASLLSLGSESLARRTLLLLHHLSRHYPRPEIEVRQHDLADMLGIARQTMQPVLKRLADDGLISLGYGEIVVADSERLFAELRRPAGPRSVVIPARRSSAGRPLR